MVGEESGGGGGHSSCADDSYYYVHVTRETPRPSIDPSPRNPPHRSARLSPTRFYDFIFYSCNVVVAS